VAGTLDTKLDGVLGGKTATAYARAFGMATVGDLLAHYPRRYARRGELTALDELPMDEEVTIVGEVRSAVERKMLSRKGSIFEVSITDGKGFVSLTFFNQQWREKELKPGVRGIFSGKISRYKGNAQLAHPDYRLFTAADDVPDSALDDAAAKAFANQLIPIYPATGSITSWQIQDSVALALASLDALDDPVPAEIREEYALIHQGAALELIHRPKRAADFLQARDTLKFHEAFVLQCALLEQRIVSRATAATARPKSDDGFRAQFDSALPFDLTRDQEVVGEEIARDLEQPIPMNRLLQGEVGSGKTLVALRAILQVIDAGGQAALLAPTEVLASQHLQSIVKSLGPDLAARLMPTLLTGQLPIAQRRKAMLRIVSGQARIVIGTHALIGDKVEFFDLGLVVVDEQHRFGVEQREALRQKGSTPPHVLVMTATPIPRTIAMTVFGDLDISTITELPLGRAAIETFVAPLTEHPGWFGGTWKRAAKEIAKGHQVFVVCPAIDARHPEEGAVAEADEAPQRPISSVETVMARMPSIEELKGTRIAALHGRMTADEKDAVMQAFAAGSLDLIVSTTVIEVGVDVPNASMMVILDADRFGVSQLHQLRGRVGRGKAPGICIFVTFAEEETPARKRVDAVAATLDGFQLAEIDLELRREGDVLGAVQSGARSSLRLLRVVADADVIGDARVAAGTVLDSDPILAGHPALRSAISRRLDDSTREYLAKN